MKTMTKRSLQIFACMCFLSFATALAAGDETVPVWLVALLFFSLVMLLVLFLRQLVERR